MSSTRLEVYFVDRFMTSTLLLSSLINVGDVLVDEDKVISLFGFVNVVIGRIFEGEAC